MEAKKFNWTEFIAIILLVALTAVVTWGVTWYFMDNQIRNEQVQSDSLSQQVAAYQAQIKAVQAKLDAATALPLTATMVQNGTYSLGGTSVTLVNGTATVGANTYTLDTKNVAYTTDKTKAVVVIKETTGTPVTTVNTYAVAVVAKDGKASQVASLALASGATVSSVAYGTDGKITVITTTTTATTPVTTVYTVSGTTLVVSK